MTAVQAGLLILVGGGSTIIAVFRYGDDGVTITLLLGLALLFFGVRGWRRAKASGE